MTTGPESEQDADGFAAALGLGYLAAKFATEPGRYPEFVAWCNTLTTSEDASWLLTMPPDVMEDVITRLRQAFAMMAMLRRIQISVKIKNDQL